VIEKVKCIELLDSLNLPKDQYLITGSAWLAVMGIRNNKDIDIILSMGTRKSYDHYMGLVPEDMRPKVQEGIDKSMKHERKIIAIAKAKNVDRLIRKHRVYIDGYPFVNFDIFWQYKKPRKRPKDREDKAGVKRFFANKMDKIAEYRGVFG